MTKPEQALPEQEARRLGFSIIAGVDEVGRGCLAGPVVASAVIFPENFSNSEIKDSKLLTAAQREKLVPVILEGALSYGFGSVEPKEIDVMNILRASLKAMRLAIERLNPKPEMILVDGNQTIPLLSIQQWAIPKGDRLSLSVSAASILAKVKRDSLMTKVAEQYPEFHFEKHKGYGTPEHWEALEKFGATPIHRMSFKGISKNALQF